MATYIHGIGASQNIDSSGERIMIAGLDISSLERDGVFTWEHDQAKVPDDKGVAQNLTIKLPANVVGKILKARKIFQESDCEDDHQKYFWDKCQTPFLYVMGVLFDDYKDSAREVAGFFLFDADHKGQFEANVVSFSVEGGKIEKKGIDLLRSIARKVTITIHPCNKAATAEIVANPEAKPGSNVDELFKTEGPVEVFKFEPPKEHAQALIKHAQALGLEPMEKAEKKVGLPQGSSNPGKQIGTTKSGKPVMSHQKIHTYEGFHAEDHRNAANIHGEAANAANAAKDWKLADHHNQKMKLHNSLAAGLERKANRLPNAIKQKHNKAAASSILGKTEASKMVAPHGEANRGEKVATGSLNKALEAGSGIAVPSSKVQGAAMTTLSKPYASNAQRRWAHTANGKKALGGEAAVHEWDEATKGKKLPERKMAKDEPPPPPPPPTLGQTATQGGTSTINSAIGNPFGKNEKKMKLLARAEQEYAQWPKREEFRAFMAKRMPHLTKGEIDAIGQTVALKKSLDAEAALATIVNTSKDSKKDK